MIPLFSFYGMSDAKATNEFQDVLCAGIVATHKVGPDAVMCAILKFVDGHIEMPGFFQRIEHRLVLLAAIGGVMLRVK